MPVQRRETFPERFARHLREERMRSIKGASSQNPSMLIQAYIDYEAWYDGDPAGTHPAPDEDHQPSFSEPSINQSGDPHIWDADDPYWIRVPADGLWVFSLLHSPFFSLNLGGTGDGYRAIVDDVKVEAWRHTVGGDFADGPEGRDDPFAPAGIWSGAPYLYDVDYLPEHHDFFSLSRTIIGVPAPLTVHDSIRVLWHPTTLDSFGASDGFFNLAYQGEFWMERVSELAPTD